MFDSGCSAHNNHISTISFISHDGSMYGIYTNIGDILMVNVTIHGSYGFGLDHTMQGYDSQKMCFKSPDRPLVSSEYGKFHGTNIAPSCAKMENKAVMA